MSLYFDYNSTTPLEPEVTQAIQTAAQNHWENPSSQYGECARKQIDWSRSMLGRMIQANPDGTESSSLNKYFSDLIFTSGGTEANHSVFHTFVNLKLNAIPHIITANTEHPSVLIPLKQLHADGHIELTVVPVSHKTGIVHFEDIVAVLRPNQTVLVSVMLANNETGAISPIEEIAQGIRKWERDLPSNSLPLGRIFIHSDMAQVVGKLPINVRSLGVDYATIVGHKFYGPRIGCLFVRGLHTYGPGQWEQSMRQSIKANGDSHNHNELSDVNDQLDGVGAAPFVPLFRGGGQERGFRAGTENTPMIAGLGKAAELVVRNLDQYMEHFLAMRTLLERSLHQAFPRDGPIRVCIFGVDRCSNISICSGDSGLVNRFPHFSGRLPNTVNVTFIGPSWLNSGAILARCPQLEASRGAACHSSESNVQGSSVLRACGYSSQEARGAIRLSLGRQTTCEQIALAVTNLKRAISELLQENS
ncbi:Selenocysteine lyase [Fasciola hepatica]|uniref:Selenocysteine lyase n=1 Tax=Fasciola hepatica TaxID=6192 RepID=A0A4E0QZG5_FASHE|nr:Selenocysteine lyase [Fasciola hepatica]